MLLEGIRLTYQVASESNYGLHLFQFEPKLSFCVFLLLHKFAIKFHLNARELRRNHVLGHVSQALLDFEHLMHRKTGSVWLIVLFEVLHLLELIVVPLYRLFLFGTLVCLRLWVFTLLFLLIGETLQVLSRLIERRLDIVRLSTVSRHTVVWLSPSLQ